MERDRRATSRTRVDQAILMRRAAGHERQTPCASKVRHLFTQAPDARLQTVPRA
jgi:hypothetical protein